MAVEIHPLLAQGVFATYGHFVIDSDTGCGALVEQLARTMLLRRTR